jgi:hypothetical protein
MMCAGSAAIDRCVDIRFMGGTELRNLAIHNGKLYAGGGYWEDRPGLEGPQDAAALVATRTIVASPFAGDTSV